MTPISNRSPFARLERTNEDFDVKGKTGHPGNYDIKEIIFRYCGREGCFAYQIATGGKDIDNAYIEKGAFYEPFTCWDWRGWISDEGDERKRRLLWERQQGFKINGKTAAHYPSPVERWTQFRKRVNDENRWYVKRIAVAHWMEMKDIEWIRDQLPALEALDLSDVQTGKGKLHLPDIKERLKWSEILNTLRNPESDLVDASAHSFLNRLKWLGLSDSDDCEKGESSFSTILPECKRLKTLSIRAPYDEHQRHDYRFDASTRNINRQEIHRKACSAILRITRNVPDTVTSIELRLYIDFLPHFLAQLEKFKSTIQRVGIDLGAWIQMYPLRKADIHECISPTIPLLRDEMIKKNAYAAYWQALEFSRTIDRVGAVSKSSEGSSTGAKSGELDAAIHEKDLQDGALYRQSSIKFYQDDGGTYVCPENSSTEDTGKPSCELGNHLAMGQAIKSQVVNSLPQLLMQLQLVARKSKIALYPLEAEPKNRSTSPIHPLALIQFEDEAEFRAREDYLHDNRYEDLPELYNWVNKTFKWRPVFDWDWFMVPETMESTLDPAYNRIYTGRTDYMARITQHFESLRAAGIPLHLLIGRRNIGRSSCYWGWPYDQQKWKLWLNKQFSANLETIAGLVDTLSILYDLRNPIDQARLEEIEAIRPHKWSTAPCPTMPCPWEGESKTNCPFSKQRQPLKYQWTGDEKPKIANKRLLQQKKPQGPVDYPQLANSSASTPPVGEDANDHDSDDSDTEDSETQQSLHYLARRAVFTREAVGWQRFWAEYALKFTSLTTLRLRMPRCFDKIGSWRLAKSLDQGKGWRLLFYTDERQHLHTEIDHFKHFGGFGEGTFEHTREAKFWPAGRFVRRSWVWSKTQLYFRELEERQGGSDETSEGTRAKRRTLEAYSEDSPEWSNCKPDVEGREMIIQIEDDEMKELTEAVKRAVAATRHEQEAEAALCPDIEALRQHVAQERLERKKLYHLGIRAFAQMYWFRGSAMHSIFNDLVGSLSGTTQTAERMRIKAQVVWLQERKHDAIPIFGKPENDSFEGRDVLRDMGWIDVGPASPLDHTHFRKWAPAHWFEGVQIIEGFTGRRLLPETSSGPDGPPSQFRPAKTSEKRKRTDGGKENSPALKKQRDDDVATTTYIGGQPTDVTVPESAITTGTTGKPTTADTPVPKPATTGSPSSKTTSFKYTSPRATEIPLRVPASEPAFKPTAPAPNKSTFPQTTTESAPETTAPAPEPTESTLKPITGPSQELDPYKAVATPAPKPTNTTEPPPIITPTPGKYPSPTSNSGDVEPVVEGSSRGIINRTPESNHVHKAPSEHNEKSQAPSDEGKNFAAAKKKKTRRKDTDSSFKPGQDNDEDNDELPPPKEDKGRSKRTTTTTTNKKNAKPKRNAAEPTSPVAGRTRAAKAKKKKEEIERKK